jgi:hypothetical protein
VYSLVSQRHKVKSSQRLKEGSVMMNRKRCLIVLIVVTILAAATNTYKSFNNGFEYSNLAVSSIVAINGRLPDQPFIEANLTMGGAGNIRSNRWLIVLLPVFLHQITNLHLDFLLFMPISGILIPILGYLITTKLVDSNILPLTYGLCLAINPQFTKNTYLINTQGFGYVFYLVLILISLKFLKNDSFNRRFFVLILVAYTMTMFSYYTTNFYSVFFVCILLLLSLFLRGKNNHAFNFKLIKILGALVFVFAIIFTSLEPYFYTILRGVSRGYSHNVLQILLDYRDTLFGAPRRPVYMRFPEHFPLSAAFYITTFFPILYFLLVSLLQFNKESFKTRLVFYSLFLTGVAHTVAYMTWSGFLQPIYFHSIYPMLAVVGIEDLSYKIRRPKIKQIYSTILLIIVTLSFVTFIIGPYATISLSRTLSSQQNFTWMAKHSNPELSIYLTSLEESGPLLFAYSLHGSHENVIVYIYRSLRSMQFLYSGYSEDLQDLKQAYSYVQPPYGEERQLRYIVISFDHFQKTFDGVNWIILPPFNNTRFLNVPNVNIVFSGLDRIVLTV